LISLCIPTFWATEIKEDESGKKIIKIKDLAYNLEAVAEVMGNEILLELLCLSTRIVFMR
jgi:hypothetical protein